MIIKLDFLSTKKIPTLFWSSPKALTITPKLMSILFFTRVIEKKPDFAEGWNKRATIYFMMGEFDKSMLDINQTLQLEPRHFGALDGMGLIFIHLDQPEKAIEIYDQMLKIFPNSVDTKLKKDRVLSSRTKST